MAMDNCPSPLVRCYADRLLRSYKGNSRPRDPSISRSDLRKTDARGDEDEDQVEDHWNNILLYATAK
jgi:hypothetical protein